ncbi:site-specific integrase [Roseibium sp.]|uniref:site-specific integrase n=1 Tax=Roseibium sp. TaxID=1936156 RepID=UPI003BADA511
MREADRYLELFRGRWRYVRRVPRAVSHLDTRGKLQVALGTASLETARIRRDAMEDADTFYWASLQTGQAGKAVEQRYEAAQMRAKALGFTYRSLDDLVANEPLEGLVERVLSLKGISAQKRDLQVEAVLGTAAVPSLTLSKALETFLEKCAAEDLSRKSLNQIKAYKKVKTRAVKNFIALVGDKPLDAITRDDAVRFHDWWQDRIIGKGGQKRLSGNSANRDIGNLRRIYREIYARLGQGDRKNPFDGLSFDDPKRLRQDVPPFPVAWIRDRLLSAESYAPVKGKFRGLNPDTLKIFLTVIETGCRPSEICNLAHHRIHLDHPVPHIEVDFDDSREIKTEASTRKIPLVGIALEAMTRAPAGFPRYRDKENSFSATMMRHLRKRGLLPSDHHVVYSLRHSFEDRLKEGGVDYEMRCRLLGHAINRPDYGEGGSLEYRRDLLKKIALPFDAEILELL